MQKSGSNQNIKAKNLYIHIPFCKSKCHYCNFVSFANKKEFIGQYFDVLKKEIKFYFNNQELKTIYIGGGTPSVINIKLYQDIIKLFNFSTDSEITMEINPATVDFEYLKNLKSLGINRLSIGIQSFDDKILKLINRAHNSKEAAETVKLARKAGFENISIDLIYGIQNMESWEKSLEQALRLEVNHISTYGLKIEENTEFYKNPPQNLPDDELQSEIYLKTIEILENSGFNQYEISNFAKTGFKSRHNLCYWKNQEYFGFGLSAHGYLDGVRYSNTENLEEYMKNPLQKASETAISEKEKLKEHIFLGLRLTEGISADILKDYSKIVEKYVSYGLMCHEGKNIRLTKQGILLSNSILAEFM